MGEGVMVAGIGCRAGVSAAQVEAAIDAAIAELCARQAAHVPAEATTAAATASTSTEIQAATAHVSASTLAAAAAVTGGEPALALAAAANGGESALALAAAAAGGTGASACCRAAITAIATPAAKTREPGIQAAAAARGVPLLAISQEALEAANPATVTRSAHSMAAMNVHSVAEAAALAGALALANGQGHPNRGPEVPATMASGPTTTERSLAPVDRISKPTPRLRRARVVVGPVTCALADTTTS